MSDNWNEAVAYYSTLSLISDGADVEQHGAENYDLHKCWSAYEQFWRYHVAPATLRPASVEVRERVANVALDMIAANYRTFVKVVAVCDFTAMLETDHAFSRREDWQRLFRNHAAAIESFCDLSESVDRILLLLQQTPCQLTKKCDEWLSLLADHQTYQDYLIGMSYDTVDWTTIRLHDDELRVATVLPRDMVLASPVQVVGSATHEQSSSRRQWLVKAAGMHRDSLIALLDRGHRQFLDRLEFVQSSHAYQQLWGW